MGVDTYGDRGFFSVMDGPKRSSGTGGKQPAAHDHGDKHNAPTQENSTLHRT